MTGKIFVLCDSDKAYGEKLYAFINSRQRSGYEMHFYTDRQELERLTDERDAEIVVIDEKLLGERPVKAGHVIVLSERETEYTGGLKGVYKYKSCDSILKEIMSYCAEVGCVELPRRNRKPINVIGIYSPIKKCFQTTFAITLGQLLATRGRAIYLNFEYYSGFEIMGLGKCRKDMSDLMYYISCGADNFGYRLASMTESIGELDYITPSHSYIMNMGVNRNEWLSLINSFEQYTDYEYLILDLSENVCGLLDVLRACSVIYTITGNDRISDAKIGQYRGLLEELSYHDVLEKTKAFYIPEFKEIPIEFEMLPYSELAGFVKKLINSEEAASDG